LKVTVGEHKKLWDSTGMSLKLKGIGKVPESTAELAHKVLKSNDPYRIMGDQMLEIVSDYDFKDLYPLEGRAGISPALLAMVLCFQAIECVSDRAAARMVVTRIDWKYALRLPLDYTGFDYSVLSEFRDRLIKHDASVWVFDKLLKRLRELGLVKGRLQRTDSLAILGVVNVLNRLEMVMETMRVTLEAIARTNEKWLRDNVPASFIKPYVERAENAWLVKEHGDKGREETRRMATRTGRDGVWLLARVDQTTTPGTIQELPEVATMRQVWAHQFDVQKPTDPGQSGDDGSGVAWREKVATAGKDTISTPHDPDARYSQKRGEDWVGYKSQITQTVEEDPTAPQAPQLITDARVTLATTADYQQTESIQQALQRRDLLPETHIVDNGYVIGETLASSTANGVDLIGPIKPDSSKQARAKTGTALDDFDIDYNLEQVRCPQGHLSKEWLTFKRHAKTFIRVSFDTQKCVACPLFAACVSPNKKRARGRILQISPYHELIKHRRQEQKTADFRHTYRRRSGIEATLSAMVRTQGLRFARFKGLAKVNLNCIFIAIGYNLKRASQWLAGVRPKPRTRQGRLAAFVPANQ
jgi:transposase